MVIEQWLPSVVEVREMKNNKLNNQTKNTTFVGLFVDITKRI